MPTNKLLLWLAVAHGVLAVVCAVLLLVRATPILGVHPALKPLKFAISVGLFLASMSVLVPLLATSDGVKRSLATVLASAMTGEVVLICMQALRGRRSHFNVEHSFDRVVVGLMMVGILALVAAMLTITVLAMSRPLAGSQLVAWSWRAALVVFFLAVGSGAAMGGRAGHTVGGIDGGPGMPLTNWSTAHGDLRISHFFAVHALQIVPIAGYVIARLPFGRGVTLATAIAGYAIVVVWTWIAAVT